MGALPAGGGQRAGGNREMSKMRFRK